MIIPRDKLLQKSVEKQIMLMNNLIMGQTFSDSIEGKKTSMIIIHWVSVQSIWSYHVDKYQVSINQGHHVEKSIQNSFNLRQSRRDSTNLSKKAINKRSLFRDSRDWGRPPHVVLWHESSCLLFNLDLPRDPPDRGIPHPYLVIRVNYVAQYYNQLKTS